MCTPSPRSGPAGYVSSAIWVEVLQLPPLHVRSKLHSPSGSCTSSTGQSLCNASCRPSDGRHGTICLTASYPGSPRIVSPVIDQLGLLSRHSFRCASSFVEWAMTTAWGCCWPILATVAPSNLKQSNQQQQSFGLNLSTIFRVRLVLKWPSALMSLNLSMAPSMLSTISLTLERLSTSTM